MMTPLTLCKALCFNRIVLSLRAASINRPISHGRRKISTVKSSSYMKAWQIQQMGGIDDLKLENIRVPPILLPNDVLVAVSASSVNPLDIAMIGGYGKEMISSMKSLDDFNQGSVKCYKDNYPLICGRDFSGEVVAVGHSVKTINIGEKVYGVVSPQRQGAHSQYVVTSDSNIAKIPEGISLSEAASIPYAALTAWSAAVISGGIVPHSARGARVLILGASGGVGTMLVQMLNSWGSEVVGVCSPDSYELMTSLGAYELYDYKDPETKTLLTSYPGFDLIVDASGNDDSSYMKGLKKWSGASYVSLSSPLLKNTDDLGMIAGAIKSAGTILYDNLTHLSEGCAHKWGFYMPNSWALADINSMVACGKIKPVIDKVYSFEQAIAAYKHASDGPSRGKTVIQLIT